MKPGRAAIALIILVGLTSCGDADKTDLSTSVPSGNTNPADPQKGIRGEDPLRTDNPPSQRTTTDSGGAVLVQPQVPNATAIKPQRGCQRVRASKIGGGHTVVQRAPAPGLSAEPDGLRAAQITVTAPRVSKGCEIAGYEIRLDSYEDALPGATIAITLKRLEKTKTVRLELAPQAGNADIAMATSLEKRGGRISDAAKIRLR